MEKNHNNASVNNTAFLTMCSYPDPYDKSRGIRMTASYFDIPLHFITWGGSIACKDGYQGYVEKLKQTLRYLYLSSSSYIYFTDCVDVCFIGSIQNILNDFNKYYTGKVIFQKADTNYPINDITFTNKILKTHHGLANAGCYCGERLKIIEVLEHCITLRQDKINAQQIAGIDISNFLYYNDQFWVQMCKLTMPELITIDIDKKIFDIFRETKDKYDALILHSPGKSWHNNPTGWVDKIKKLYDC